MWVAVDVSSGPSNSRRSEFDERDPMYAIAAHTGGFDAPIQNMGGHHGFIGSTGRATIAAALIVRGAVEYRRSPTVVTACRMRPACASANSRNPLPPHHYRRAPRAHVSSHTAGSRAWQAGRSDAV